MKKTAFAAAAVALFATLFSRGALANTAAKGGRGFRVFRDGIELVVENGYPYSHRRVEILEDTVELLKIVSAYHVYIITQTK